MDTKPISDGHPEKKIERAIMEALRERKWYVKKMHGSIYQSGFPDIFAFHRDIGLRLIEVKLPGLKGSRFTSAQIHEFGQMHRHGLGVWVLTSVEDISKLAQPANSIFLISEKL